MASNALFSGQLIISNQKGEVLDEGATQKLVCFKCNQILSDPRQTECGERICKACISRDIDCPACEKEDCFQNGFVDMGCKKQLERLIGSCRCGWQGPLIDWEGHGRQCSATHALADGGTGGTASVSDMEMASVVQQLQTGVHVVETTLSNLKSSITKEIKAVREEIAQTQATIDTVSDGMTSLGQKLEELHPSGAVVAASGGVASEDMRKKLVKVEDAVNQLKTSFNGEKSMVDHVERQLNLATAKYDKALDDLKLQMELLQVKSTTGIYVWKINDLQRRRNEAIAGTTTSLYSPPFYTSQHGYRLCLRCYLNGDGVGKDTHVSLYIVVMRSDYDSLLSWPFKHRVALTLLNQEDPFDSNASHTQRFLPNPESASFKRPVESFNVASGFPEFAPISILTNPEFVKDDTIYFRAKVDPPQQLNATGPDQVQY